MTKVITYGTYDLLHSPSVYHFITQLEGTQSVARLQFAGM